MSICLRWRPTYRGYTERKRLLLLPLQSFFKVLQLHFRKEVPLADDNVFRRKVIDALSERRQLFNDRKRLLKDSGVAAFGVEVGQGAEEPIGEAVVLGFVVPLFEGALTFGQAYGGFDLEPGEGGLQDTEVPGDYGFPDAALSCDDAQGIEPPELVVAQPVLKHPVIPDIVYFRLICLVGIHSLPLNRHKKGYYKAELVSIIVLKFFTKEALYDGFYADWFQKQF